MVRRIILVLDTNDFDKFKDDKDYVEQHFKKKLSWERYFLNFLDEPDE